MPVEPGLQARIEHVVSEADTAIAVGSGDVPVLATPRLVALAEAATLAAVRAALPDGTTTVGTRVDVEHLRASGVGDRVVVHAVVTEVSGTEVSGTEVDVRTLRFAVTATGPAGDELLRGEVVRAVVDRERFLARLYRSRP